MDLTSLIGAGLVGSFAFLIFVFNLLGRRRGAKAPPLRPIPALQSLPSILGTVVETGQRLHVALGSGTVGESNTAATLAGLTVLDQITDATTLSDKPPIATAADGTALLLAQGVLRHAYDRQNALERYEPGTARVAGMSPWAYGAALSTVVKDEAIVGNVLIGPVGPEALLLTEASERAGTATVASSDNPAVQALLFAAAENSLIGEDLFAGGAYLGRQPAHIASLRAQDIVRIVIVIVILVGVVLKTLGVL
jgi:hypothetical protein